MARQKSDRAAILKLSLVMAIGLGAGAGAMYLATLQQSKASVADTAALAGLQTQAGKPFDPVQLNGRHVVLYFGYTYCPDACPTALYVLASALKTMPDARVQPVFMTVDPRRDTPQVLTEYLAHFAPNIIGLTGQPDDVQRALRRFGVIAIETRDPKSPNGYAVDHTNEFILLSPRGKLLERIPATVPATRLTETIARAIKESA